MLKRILIFLIVLAVLFGLAFAYYYFFISKREPAFNGNQPINSNLNAAGNQLPPANNNVNQNINKPAVIIDPVVVAKNNLTALAISFAERFGSYSNQSNFSNIVELKPFMTSQMSRWADGYIEKIKQESGSPAIYHGYTARVLKADIVTFDEQSGATLILSTQREEQTGARTNSRTYYQDIKLEMAKEQGVWKVAGAYWE